MHERKMEEDCEPPSYVNFDTVYSIAGAFGAYQVALCLTAATGSFLAVEPMAMNFVGYEPQHWCYVPELANFTFSDQKHIAIPSNDGEYSHCEQYDLNYTEYSVSDFLTWNRTLAAQAGVRTCDRWVYDRSVVVNSIVSKWDLVCGRGLFVDLVSTLNLAGRLVGTLPVGIVADRYGRKVAFLLSVVIKVVGNFGSTFAPNVAVLCLSRLLMGIGNSGVYLTALILIIEMVGPSYRSLVGVCYALINSLGFTAIGAIAFFIRDDVKFQLVTTSGGLVLFLVFWFLPESPRWLLLESRHNAAEKVIKNMAEVNGRHVCDDFDVRQFQVEEEAKSTKTILEIVRHPVLLKRFLILSLHWFTDSLVYYALSLNTATLSGSVYTNTVLAGAVEIPANILAIFALNWRRLGRRLTTSLSLVVAGIGCLVCVPLIIRNEAAAIVTGLSLFGKAGATIGFTAIYVYTSELFPTDIRNIGVAACSLFGHVSSMVSVFVGGPLGDVWRPLPSLVFGVFSLAAGGFALLLPETLGTPLLDSIDQLPPNQHSDPKGAKRHVSSIPESAESII